jgi:hypothetical protein
VSGLDRIFGSMDALADLWRAEAARRRKLTAVDPAADVLEHCASELTQQTADLRTGVAVLTVGDYARLKHVTPQTVRRWIRRGELPATGTSEGYVIPRDARRTRAAA